MNLNKLIYKKLAPFIGKLFDKLFFTDFGKRASNYYHLYDQNDYKFEKDEYCFIHVPRTGGWSFRNYFENFDLPFYANEKKGHHNPVSLLCPPGEYKYVTIVRDPIERVRSHFQMFQEAKESSVNRGLINFLRYSSEVKNLYCQYFSGLIGESVDERVFNIALKNLKLFNEIIIFENYENDLKNFFNQFQIKNFSKKFHNNKSPEKILKDEEREAIKIYNYWDIKLYEEILAWKNSKK